MNFEDVAIAFSQAEWEVLDEAQKHLYCDVMLEVFALVSFVGPWHKMDDVEAYSEHNVSVGDSHVRASKTAQATQRTHLCKPCFSVLKDILHLSELQVAYFQKNVFLSDACVRDLCFSVNPHQQQKDACGEKPWKEDMESASLATSCCFYLSGVPEASTEVGVDSPGTSGLLQHQATLNTEEPHINNELSQEFLSGKRHHQWVECETAVSHKQKIAYQKGLCSGDMINENNKCGKVCVQIFNHLQHGRVHTTEKPYECTDCGKVFSEIAALIKHNRVHIRENQYKCSDFEGMVSLYITEFTLEKRHMSVLNVGSPSIKDLTSLYTTEFTLEKRHMSVVNVDMHFEDVAIAFSQEEWVLLDEAQRHLYCNVMLEVFALVSSLGCWHKKDEEEAYSDQSVSVQGESHVRALNTAAAIHKSHFCSPRVTSDSMYVVVFVVTSLSPIYL
ncbi:zinc finger protein 416-like [Eptesicus fuscus]|uniref:zinc finger protein 416-like n=1 Tax=Eptesicus fuscus TaxID=29078 RepID=UPI00240438F8|nr:zinc finger protein 416-like [Eptesicus fuscus]